MKRIIVPYAEEIIRKLNDEGRPCSSPKYSAEWVMDSLDKDRIEGKYGKEWSRLPPDIQNYYRAEGYLHAVYQMAEREGRKENSISCDLKEILSQEIAFEIKDIVLKALNQYLS